MLILKHNICRLYVWISLFDASLISAVYVDQVEMTTKTEQDSKDNVGDDGSFVDLFDNWFVLATTPTADSLKEVASRFGDQDESEEDSGISPMALGFGVGFSVLVFIFLAILSVSVICCRTSTSQRKRNDVPRKDNK